jgi:hypothetical protein
MHLVNQITPFTCGLACIESVTHDLGFVANQGHCLARFKKLLINSVSDIGDFGATNTPTIALILTELGYKAAPIRDFRIPEIPNGYFKPLDHSNQAIIIQCRYQDTAWHAMRYTGMKDDDTIFAMVPSFGRDDAFIEEIPFRKLVDWDYSFVFIQKDT